MIEFEGKDIVSYEETDIIFKVGNLVLSNPWLFQMLTEILIDCKNPANFNEEVLEIIVEDPLEMGKITNDEFKLFSVYIKELYGCDSFSVKKGKILEFIIAHIGSFHLSRNQLNCKQDCRILKNGEEIVESDKNFDVVYYNCQPICIEQIEADIYECKADISNFLFYVKGKEPPVKRKTYEKLQLMKQLYEFFAKNQHFFVSFATLVYNVERAKEILKELSFEIINIVAADKIFDKIKSLNQNGQAL